jgi:excisionase family DNA binding protein
MYLTVRQVARLFGFGERALRNLIASGALATYRPPGCWPRLRRTDVEAYIESQRVETPSPSPHDDVADRVERCIRKEDARGAV